MAIRRSTIAHVLGASVLALTAASVAQAQDTADAEDVAALDDNIIIVSAEFRDTNLQETPLAITALTSEALESRSLDNVADVGRSVPSVTLRVASAGYGKSTQAYIRGIGQSDFNFALEPAVGFYVDDVYHASLFGSVFDLLDLERVEILRGPQGTLFGKNSIGGAVRLISQKPSNELEASVKGTYGSYERLDLRGMVNLPLIDDTLALRVSGASKQRDGYVDRVDFACANPDQAGNLQPTVTSGDCTVGTLGGESVRAGRAALRWTPDTAVEVNLTAEIMRDSSEGAADSLIHISPTTALNNYNANKLVPTYGIPFDSRFVTDPYVTYASYRDLSNGRQVPATNTMNSESFSGDVKVHLSDSVTLRSITAYQRFSGRFTQNADNSPLPIALTDNNVSFRQVTQELRLQGEALDGLLEWTTGAFYFDSKAHIRGGVSLPASGPNGIVFDQNDQVDGENKSAFVHAIVHPTDRLSVTAGVRYSDEAKTYRFDRTNQPSGTPFFAGGAFTAPEATFDRFDYKLGIDYQWTDDLMTYAQYSTGFKGGGINPRPFTPASAVPFGPETLDAYEIGLKSEFFDRMVRLNLAAYYSDYTNMQLSANGMDNLGNPSIVISNVGEATIKGLEAELTLNPAPAFVIEASGSYTDFEITDLGAAAGVSGGPTLDSKAPGTPEWKFNLGAQYTAEIDGFGSLTPRFDLYYQSRVFNEYTNNPLAAEPGYTVANARLTYDSPGEDWSLALGVTNLFNKFYYVNRFIQAGGYNFTGQPSRPREWSVTLSKDF
ncbi:TonB-dependent receptor [Altericroceibacterium endophyticum]|nr:TonB-dependent receptor [Altericroceibacterium endophyticum]